MDDTNGRKHQVTAEQEDMLKKVAEVAAKKLTPTETHSICVLLSMAFGRGTLQSKIFAWHVNEVRVNIGRPWITDAAAGNPTMDEKMQILRSAVEKLGDEAQAVLIQVLLLSPMYASAQQSESDQEGFGDS